MESDNESSRNHAGQESSLMHDLEQKEASTSPLVFEGIAKKDRTSGEVGKSYCTGGE